MKVFLPTVVASVLLAACGSSSSSSSSAASSSATSSSTALVKTASNSTLGRKVLVNSQGLTLYHLTAEQNGKFICTSGCVKVWHPLAVASGTTPTGTVGSLGVVKRPDGTEQVTYKGMPLYTFAQDTAPGQAKGQGIKDVGTWMAVTTTAAKASVPSSGGSSGVKGY